MFSKQSMYVLQARYNVHVWVVYLCYNQQIQVLLSGLNMDYNSPPLFEHMFLMKLINLINSPTPKQRNQ